jgi:outer membrane biogenesis lipoprotein LolB
MFVKRWLIPGLLLLLSACAHVPGPEATTVKTSQLESGQQWQLAGRFVAGQRASDAAEGTAPDPVAGRFAWQHQKDDDTLWLIGPLGNALAKIELTPAGVRWQDATGKRGEATSLQALGESLAGVRLPDVAADAWLRGRWTKTAVKTRDAEGRVLSAGARGWVFEYRYGAPAPEAWPLAIEGAGPDGLWVRVALTEWDGVSDPADRPAP